MDLEKTTVFMFHFFLKIKPRILSRGRLIVIKKFITTSGTDFSSSANLISKSLRDFSGTTATESYFSI